MNLENSNVATALIVIAAIVGAVMVVLSAVVDGIDPDLRLSFEDYIQALFVGGGLLSVGRGLKARRADPVVLEPHAGHISLGEDPPDDDGLTTLGTPVDEVFDRPAGPRGGLEDV